MCNWNRCLGRSMFFLGNLFLISSTIYMYFELSVIADTLLQTPLHIFGRTLLTWIPRVTNFLFSTLATITLWRGTYQDPGLIPLGLTPPKDSKLSEKFLTRMCMKCNNSWKPPRAHHCSVCNRCVFRMDHHCDWLNNCVGIGTIKLFYLFLVYTALHCFHTLTCLALEFGLTFHFRGSEILYELVIDVQARKILGIAFAFFGLFFLIFTLDFIYEQTTCIFANQTIIDSEQNIRGSPRSKTANFSAVFGGEPSFRWLLPNPAQAPVDYEEMLYRFRVVPPSNLNGHDKAE
eukprot:TRINITY_DN3271_c0_g1_i15.p1 TRINITY_DN3271_c0_g1~~TRINITY_DN3271_c0_g1_i15.p1  ORF type:complete len:290 (-),score=20.48 TRINITY_DN3271_c0_g1_i15:125-994(-)